ncbi:hypothetical protein PM082_009371 [Marasmius tenuissimus]|nr:hypothetical protein PM082_009371 [Marasmius tenuissimus]
MKSVRSTSAMASLEVEEVVATAQKRLTLSKSHRAANVGSGIGQWTEQDEKLGDSLMELTRRVLKEKTGEEIILA